MDYKKAFSTLFAFAACEGNPSSTQIRFLEWRASEWGLTQSDVDAISVAQSGREVEIHLPDEKSDRLHLLRELVLLIGVDEKASKIQMQMFSEIRTTMGVTENELQAIVDNLQ